MFGYSKAMEDKWFLEEGDLDLPQPPDIFKGNIYFLKNKRMILVCVFLVLLIPLLYMTLAVHQDGLTYYVDHDIKRFRLKKNSHGKVNNPYENHAGSFGNFKDASKLKQDFLPDMSVVNTVTNITVGVISCDNEGLENTIVSIKSVVISALNYNVNFLHYHVFVDSYGRKKKMAESLEEIKTGISWSSQLTFTYDIQFATKVFPRKDYNVWMNMNKKCSAMYLFVKGAIPETKEILFLHTDTLVLGDIREVWALFYDMDQQQFAGVALHQDIPTKTETYFETHTRVPFVPPTGITPGVMLFNLTRMRQYDWVTRVTKTFESFGPDLVFGDVDILNVMFYFNREFLKIIPCVYNYRRMNCRIEQHCIAAQRHPDGIQILHGDGGSFEKDGDFRRMYEVYRNFDLSGNDFKRDIVLRIKWHYKKLQLTKTVYSSGCTVVSQNIFNRWLDSNELFGDERSHHKRYAEF